MTSKQSRETRLVRSGIGLDTAYGSVMPPVHMSTNFIFPSLEDVPEYDYARSGNPTRAGLEKALAEIEQAASAIFTPTGMAAIDLVLALLKPGDLVLAAHDCYGGTHRLLSWRAKQGHFNIRFVDFSDTDNLSDYFEEPPRMVFIETPSNPLLRITNIEAVTQLSRKAGALTVVDNTFLSPLGQQPIKLGADIVVHSTTKYINGHSDVLGGAVISATAELGEELAWIANSIGTAGGAFDTYLTQRGLRTMGLRVRQQFASAAIIADMLVAQESVKHVYYPGLGHHPGHELATRQQSGFGGIISFSLERGLPAVKQLASRLNLFSLAESLGGVESLIAHPASMTHRGMDASARLAAGIGDDLVRLSVGVEDASDLCEDLQEALKT